MNRSQALRSFCLMLLLGLAVPKAEAGIPIAELIRQGVKRVIIAVDLKIQRMQNETIWLQQAQQEMENILSKTKLEEISTWSSRQKELYSDYYAGFWKVKQGIANFQRVREIIATQQLLLTTYGKTWNLLVKEGQFSPNELALIEERFSGILNESLLHIAALTGVLKNLTFQLSDGERLEQIHLLDRKMQDNYQDLVRLSIQLESLNQQRMYLKSDQRNLQNLFQP